MQTHKTAIFHARLNNKCLCKTINKIANLLRILMKNNEITHFICNAYGKHVRNRICIFKSCSDGDTFRIPVSALTHD